MTIMRESLRRGSPTRRCLSAVLGCFALAATVAAGATEAVRVTNFTDGETIRYPVVLIRGELADAKADRVTVVNTSSKRDTREMVGLARRGRFKALAELVPGPNKLRLRAGKAESALTIAYKPQTNPRVVRVVYFTDRTGGTAFQTPRSDDRQDWRGKLGTAMKLMQCFTAERLNDIGLGRRTFNLELGGDGKVKVHLLKGSRDAAYYHKLDGGRLYSEIGRELRRKLPNRYAKNLVIPAMTRFDANTGKVYAHTALGGGNLALFGGGDLFTWPDRLADAQKAFMDAARVDPKKWFSDSVGRHAYWAIASTTMGAALHELGHTFALPHSGDRHDIMTRGHDRFNRFFTLIEPPHARRSKPYEFKETEIAAWTPVSGAALAPHRHFAVDRRTWRDEEVTVIRLDRASKSIVVESDYGIHYLALRRHGPRVGTQAVHGTATAKGRAVPRKVAMPLAEIRKRMGKATVSVLVIDGQGLSTSAGLAELMSGPFVRAWRFASITQRWRDPKAFAEVDAKKLKAIEASAASRKLARSPKPLVDFLALSGSRRRSNVAGYAVRTIRCEKARKVKIHTGSDDALRVWVNGKLAGSVLALRGAQADSESHHAELRKGTNTLVAEVSQGGGGWGLILRIADADGTKLELKDDGRLVPVEDLPGS